MKRKVLACDVDLTVVDAVTNWQKWYTGLTGHEIGEVTAENNNLEELMHKHDDPLAYWKKPDIYDNLQPYDDAVEALRRLSKYVDIIFVSACFPEHETSKKYFLQRHFPYMSGFVSTQNKKYIKCDYFVDDYKKYVREVQETGAQVYQIKSNINSDSAGEFPYMEWGEIMNDIIEKESHD